MDFRFTFSSLALSKTMARRIPSTSRNALLCRLFLFALYANASQHLTPGYAYDDKMICTTPEFAETSSISALRDGPHVLNMTMYDRDTENLLRANSRKLNQRCSKGFLTCFCHSLKQAEDERQDSPDGPLFVCRSKHKLNLLKGDALYELKFKRTLRISTTIGASSKEGASLRHEGYDEDSISLRDGKSNVPFCSMLRRKFWPVARNDLVEPWISGAIISNFPKNDYHDLETRSLEVAEVQKQGSDRMSAYLLICKPWEGFSGDDNLSSLRDPLNHTTTTKVIAHVDHVRRNIQFEGLSSLQHGRQSPTGGRRLFAVTPVTSPAAAPGTPVASPPPPNGTPVVAPPTPMSSSPPPVVVLSPPPLTPSPPPPLAMLSPPPVMPSSPPPVAMLSPPPVMPSPPPPMVMLSPPPVMAFPPPPPNGTAVVAPPTPMSSSPPPMVVLSPPPVTPSPPPPLAMLSPPPVMPSPPPPLKAYAPFPPPPPPIASFNFVPPDEMHLLQTTITAPDSYNINNLSVYTTGVDIPFVNVTPSSILLLKFASSMRVDPVKLPALHNGKKSSEGDRRLVETAPIMRRLFQVPTSAPGAAPVADWYPQTQGISQGLTISLQVDAGSLLVLLPGYLINPVYSSRQATVNGNWLPMTESSEPWVWVPGPGLQFLGSIDEINDALLTLEFGVNVGTDISSASSLMLGRLSLGFIQVKGKARTCTLTVMAAHLFDNLTAIDQSSSTKTIKLNIASASAWFVIVQYAKTFYKNSLGVLCFFALLLVILCCILGCCVCHDAKMEKIFQKNRTVLKEQDAALKENMVFNPVWVPSAPVIPGRKRFIIVHNPKFLQQRLADHLSSLHGALVEKVVSNRDFDEHLRGEEDMQDVSEMDPFSSYFSAGFSESEGMPHGLASGTPPADNSDDEGGSHSTHYSIKDGRKPGPPLSPGGFSGGSDSTHYDIGSSGGDSD